MAEQYVNVYLIERVYYATDRWYERGRCVTSVPYSQEALTQAEQEALHENTNQPLSSVVNRGMYVVRVENYPGEDFPKAT